MQPKCRHCGKPISRTAGDIWADPAGFAACVKGGMWRDPLTDEVKIREPVLHQPMPVIR